MKKYIISSSCLIILNGCFQPPVRMPMTTLTKETRSTIALCSNGLKEEDVIKIDAEYHKNKGTIRAGTESNIEGRIVIDGEDRTEFYRVYVNCIKSITSQAKLDKKKNKKQVKIDDLIYKTEHNSILKFDSRLTEFLQDYWNLVARTIRPNGKFKLGTKTPKDKCYKALGTKKTTSKDAWNGYFNILKYQFKKLPYKDIKANDIINLCSIAANIYPSKKDYLYYIAIGHHMNFDYKSAINYLNLSEKEGSLDAKRKLGIIYFTGVITKKNKELGKKLLLQAASIGDIPSRKILEVHRCSEYFYTCSV